MTDSTESTTNDVNDESFYGVFVETDVNESGRFSLMTMALSFFVIIYIAIVYVTFLGKPKVFTAFKETLSVVKSNKTARFKLFKSATEAKHFSIYGPQSPVKQVETNNVCNVPTSFSFKSLKSEDLVAFRCFIESGELDKVKEAVNLNPRFLVSSGDTPSIIQVILFVSKYPNLLLSNFVFSPTRSTNIETKNRLCFLLYNNIFLDLNLFIIFLKIEKTNVL